MTKNELCKRYDIPPRILECYSAWNLFNNRTGSFDDRDLKCLSMVLTLIEVGFSLEEVEQYMLLVLQGKSTVDQRENLLRQKRNAVLDEIHMQQKCLDTLDYLKYEIQNNTDEDLR